MWVTAYDFSSKKRIFCPKTSKFGPKLAFLVNLGQAMQAYSVPCCGSVGCVARGLYLARHLFTLYYDNFAEDFDPHTHLPTS